MSRHRGLAPPVATQDFSGPPVRLGLSHSEDGELRRLNFLAMFGRLSPEMEERFLELRRRDRRGTVRDV